MSRMRNFCFTIHCHAIYNKLNWKTICSNEAIRFLIFQEELGTGPTMPEHLQGYCELTKQLRLSGIKAIFNCNTMHVEKRQGSAKQAADYCRKIKTRLPDGLSLEYGTITHQGVSSGYLEVMADCKTGKEMFYIMEHHQEMYLKYSGSIEKAIRLYAEHIVEEKEIFKLTTWQTKVWLMIQHDIETSDNRTILWIHDPHGNTGKSWFAGWLMTEHKAAYFTNARTCDIAYAWKKQEICVFDLTRTTEGKVNYGAIESLKNGKVFSSKYHSGVKTRRHVTIIVMANWEPDYSAMSKDRWFVITLNEEDQYKQG